MRSTAIRFGLSGAAILLLSFFITWKFGSAPGNISYQTSEMLGWVSILVSLGMIPLGVRYYRDRVQKGPLSFGDGFKAGILIGLLPAVAMGVFTYFIFPLFMEVYEVHFQNELAKAAETMTEEQVAQMKAQMGPGSMMWNPVFQAFVMFFTVLIPAVMIAAVSALFLQRKEGMP